MNIFKKLVCKIKLFKKIGLNKIISITYRDICDRYMYIKVSNKRDNILITGRDVIDYIDELNLPYNIPYSETVKIRNSMDNFKSYLRSTKFNYETDSSGKIRINCECDYPYNILYSKFDNAYIKYISDHSTTELWCEFGRELNVLDLDLKDSYVTKHYLTILNKTKEEFVESILESGFLSVMYTDYAHIDIWNNKLLDLAQYLDLFRFNCIIGNCNNIIYDLDIDHKNIKSIPLSIKTKLQDTEFKKYINKIVEEYKNFVINNILETEIKRWTSQIVKFGNIVRTEEINHQLNLILSDYTDVISKKGLAAEFIESYIIH